MRKNVLIAMLAVLTALPIAAQQQNCMLTMPVYEQFDSYGTGTELVPTCWFVTRNYDIGYSPHLDGSRHYSGIASMVLYPGTLAESHYSMIISPEIDGVSSFEGLHLCFRLFSLTTSARLEVGICEDTNRYSRAFVPLDTLHVDQGSRWQEMVVDLSAYSGVGRRLAFRMQRALQTDNDACWIDDVAVSSCGTTTPWANHVGNTTVTLNFEPYGIGTVEVRWSDTVISPAVSPLTITGLTPDSDYVFQVGCAGSEGETVAVHTLESAGMTIAYYENFDAVDSVVPRHWRRPTTNKPQVTGGVLRMTPTAGDSCIAVLPLPTGAVLSDLNMALTVAGSSNVWLVVGAMEYADEPESFVAIDTLQAAEGRQMVSLAGYAGDGQYLALCAVGSGTLTVDELRIARCMIDNVRLYNLTESSVTLTWDTVVMAQGAEVQIEYGPTGFEPGSGMVVVAQGQPLTLDSLANDQDYDLYITPSCGDQPSAYDKHRFHTFAHEVTTPYCTGFEEGELPQGWVVSDGSTLTEASYQGSGALRIAAGGTAVMPLLGNDTPDTFYLEFYGFGNANIVVGRMATPYSPFVSTDTLAGNGSWTRYIVRVTGGANSCLALRSASSVWTIDAVALRTGVVQTVAVSAIEQHSAQVSWVLMGGDRVRIEYAAVQGVDFVPGSGTVVVADSTITLTGLASDTRYCLHVSPYDSAANGSCHYFTEYFTTMPSAIELPYCQNFDGLATSSYPANWRRLSDYGEYPLVSSDRNRSGGRSLRMSVFGNGSTVAILPDMETCSQHVALAFWANATTHHQDAVLLVGSITDATDASTFVATDTLHFTAADSWVHHMTRFTPGAGHTAIMLRGAASGETRVFVEDLCLEPCVAQNLRVSDIDSTGVTVSWTTEDSLSLVCQIGGGGVVRTDTLRQSPVTLGGFNMGTSYSLTFTTLCGCGARGTAYRPGEGSTGTTANGGRVTISLNTHAAQQTMPYCHAFEMTTGSRPYLWRYSGTMTITDRNYHDGFHSLQTSGGSTLILPPMGDVGNAVVSLFLFGTNATLMSAGVAVGIMNHPDSADSFIPLDTLRLTTLGVWQHLVADLTAYEGTGRYIALRPAAGAGTLFVDDLMVSRCGISAATASNSGLLTFKALNGVSRVAVEYGPTGFIPGSGTYDTIECGAGVWQSYQMAGLDGTTSYDIYLKSICSDLANCQQIMVQTGNAATTPYCQDFDDTPEAGMTSGWVVSRTYNNTPSMAVVGGNQRLNLKAAVGNRSIAVLPLFDVVDIEAHQLSMSLRVANHNRTRLIVGQISDASDPNTFSPRDTVTVGSSTDWHTVRLALGRFSGTDRIALACDATTQTAEMWIDDVTVTRGLTPEVAVLSARSIQLTNADTDYYVEYGLSGTMQGNGTVVHITSDTATIAGLVPQQTYWLYCRDDAAEATCMEPLTVVMPGEESLPYCHRRDTLSSYMLPELEADEVSTLHIYFTLRGGSPVVVGVMERQNDWGSFVPVDTVTASAGTWSPIHVSLAAYNGSGRFVALKTTNGTNAVIDAFKVSECELPTVTLYDDNSVAFTGSGAVEYGPSGFVPGSGTLVTCPRTIVLADTTLYDFYPLCAMDDAACGEPIQIATSVAVALPYCENFDSGMPVGWTPFSDAVNSGSVSSTGQLALQVSAGQTVGVQMPALPSGLLHFSFDKSGTASVVLCGDTIAGSGRKHVSVVNNGRPQILAIGSGTAYIDNLMVESCELPDSLTVSQPGNGRVELTWDTNDYWGFYIEYTFAGLPQGSGNIRRADVAPLVLSLEPDTVYNIYLRCDSLLLTCRPPQRLTTLAALTPIPYCTNFDADAVNEKPAGWRALIDHTGNYARVTAGSAHSGNQKLTVSNYYGTTYLVLPQPAVDSLRRLNVSLYARFHNSNGHSLVLGTMSDASDPSTFDSLTSFASMRNVYRRCFYTLDSYYGNGRFLALKVADDDVVDIDDVRVNSCAAYGFRMTEREADHVVIEWEQQGTPEVSIVYGPRGFDEADGVVVHPVSSPCRIENLSPLTNYAFYASGQCADSTACPDERQVDTFYTFTPQGGAGCIDYTDLTASYVTCSYGSYANPMENIGAVDYGYQSAQSRHTVHFDTAERDSRTGGLLRTIPVNEQASVRLGNWMSGGNSMPQAESITYGFTVDAAEADLLVLRYAAVLQDPEHAAALQPRFRLEILNQEGALIDSCSMADFIANANLGWAQAANEVLWKDWTTYGVDLMPYDGQTIFVRLTTNDCGEGSHFGYAYFTLRCASKLMQTEGCSDVPNNRFTVPTGFNYRWYSSEDTTATISDSSSIWVRSDNSVTYYCQLSFVDNPSCNFTMSAFAGARYPLAIIDTVLTVADCEFDLQLNNHSTISGDGVTPLGTGEPCETYRWVLPDGTTSTAVSPSLHFADTGTTTVTLIVGIANDQCIDTLTRDIHIAYPYPSTALQGRNARCDNDEPDTIMVVNATQYQWAGGSGSPQIITPLADTVLTCYTVDTNGCHDTLSHTLVVHPTYDINDADSVCSSSSPYVWRDTVLTFTTSDEALSAMLSRHSEYGCDSVMTLALHLWDDYYPQQYDTICDLATLSFFDTMLATTGSYLHIDSTMFGCDSLTTMHLTVMPNKQTDDSHVVCDSLRWIDGQLYLADTADVDDTLSTIFGCDSVVTLYLTVNPSKHYVFDDTVCGGSQYLFRGHYYDETGYYADTLATTENCDSVLGVNLTVIPMPHLSVDSSYDCGGQNYIMRAVSDVPYIWWLSSPDDPSLGAQNHEEQIVISPDTVTTYRLYADYRPQPLCPVVVEFTVSLFTLPEAKMRVSPRILNIEQLSFEARDVGNEYAWRQWFIDDELLDWTGRVIHSTAEADADTVSVMLVVGDGRCTDTALMLLPVEHTDLVVPNAFTPGAETNREFYVVGYNIERYEINVYNRRGVLVYRSDDISGRWDGRNLEGYDCPSGNYIYYILYSTVYRPEKMQKQVGSVLLIR